jgi:Xaa-Pro aminopeptidase
VTSLGTNHETASTRRRPFSGDEVMRRRARCVDAIVAAGLDGLVASSYPSSYYLTGCPIHPFGRPSVTVLTATGQTILIASIIEQAHIDAQASVDDILYYYDYGVAPGFDDPLTPIESFTRLLTEAVADVGLAACRIGFEEMAVSVDQLSRWEAMVPAARFVGASRLLAKLRLVLSPQELELVRSADRTADVGQAAVLEALAAGATAREVETLARERMLDLLGTEMPDSPFALRIETGLGDVRKSAGHSEWVLWSGYERPSSGQVIASGVDVLLWGYAGNIERTVAVEPVSGRVRRDFETMVRAGEAGIDAARVGNTLADVDRACKKVLSTAGHTTRSGSGLGRGIVSFEGNARELLMDVRLYSDVALEAGMAISIEPDLLTSDGTYRHCNTVIITEKGPAVDSALERGVIVVAPPSAAGSPAS